MGHAWLNNRWHLTFTSLPLADSPNCEQFIRSLISILLLTINRSIKWENSHCTITCLPKIACQLGQLGCARSFPILRFVLKVSRLTRELFVFFFSNKLNKVLIFHECNQFCGRKRQEFRNCFNICVITTNIFGQIYLVQFRTHFVFMETGVL